MILVFLFGSLSRTILLLDYELRQDYIANFLCEKKDIPNNSCHGACHLKKELKAQNEQERNQGNSFLAKFELNSLAPIVSSMLIFASGINFRFLPYQNTEKLNVFLNLFRPPNELFFLIKTFNSLYC